MKIAIDIGHNAPPDTGASSQFGIEDKLTYEVGNLVIRELEELGHEVINVTPKSASSVVASLQQRVTIANQSSAAILVSIHFNAFNCKANGTEVFAISNRGKIIADRIVSNIAELGYRNRGVKEGNHLYLIRHTKPVAVLVECCFIDNERDMRLLDTVTMAKAIAKGIVGKDFKSNATIEFKKSSIEDTKRLQKLLNLLFSVELVEDGIFGPNTLRAVNHAQNVLGLRVEEDITSELLNSLKYIIDQPIVRPNHAEGLIVRYIRHKLGLSTSKSLELSYEGKIVEMIKSFQADKNLSVDGIIGPQTWSTLFLMK